MSITITERAALEVKRVMEEQHMAVDQHVLRVGISAGGCSGFQYKLGFEKREEGDVLNDTVLNVHGIEVRVDRKSELYLEGTTIDFHEGLDRRGFTFDNPKAKGGCCGCGQSFQA